MIPTEKKGPERLRLPGLRAAHLRWCATGAPSVWRQRDGPIGPDGRFDNMRTAPAASSSRNMS